MLMSLRELKDTLALQYDECDLIYLLEVTSEDIVEAFTSHIRNNMERLAHEVNAVYYEPEDEEDNEIKPDYDYD